MCKTLYCICDSHCLSVTLHEYHRVWNHWQLDCLLKSSFRTPKEASKVCITGPLWETLPVTGTLSGFPHKGPVIQKAYPLSSRYGWKCCPSCFLFITMHLIHVHAVWVYVCTYICMKGSHTYILALIICFLVQTSMSCCISFLKRKR